MGGRRARIRELMAAIQAFRPSAGRRGRPMTAAELDAFEAAEGVVLPPSHRAFLEAFGDGAWLPAVVGGYALPLAAHRSDPVASSFEGRLTEPFGFTGSVPVALPWDDAADDYVRPDPLRGTICLGSGGCDVVHVVVVTGAARDTVWTFVPGLEEELHPTGLDVLDWAVVQMERAVAEARKFARWRGEG